MGDEESEYKVQYLDAPDSEEPQEFNWLVRPGKAKVTYPGGHTFEGTFDGERMKQGYGVYVWMNPPNDEEEVTQRAKYEGEYKDGKKHGTGKMEFPNGDIYHGMWENNQMHGEGTYTYKKTGDIFSGIFENNVKTGNGQYYFASDESQFRGEWKDGTIEAGTWAMKGFADYEGKFQKGRPIGEGKFTFENSGIVQTGEYVVKKTGEEEEEAEEEEDAGPKEMEWKGKSIVVC